VIFLKCPRLEINLKKIKKNASLIKNICNKHNIEVVGITKGFCALLPIARSYYEGGITKFGDSRLLNLKRLTEGGIHGEKYLIRIPMLSEVLIAVKWSDVSLNSEIETINTLGVEAKKRNKSHGIILMVDVGDLREGVLPEDVINIVKSISIIQGVNFVGLGLNVGCFGGVLPSFKNTMILVELAKEIKQKLGLEVNILSGGTTSGLVLIEKGELAPGINQFRVGEGIIIGTDTTGERNIKGTNQDTIKLVAEVIELKKKPSVPIGEIGRDGFGNKPHFENKGIRLRAILAIGRQDVTLEKLIPEDNRIEVLGGSSDHLIVDVTESSDNFYIGKEVYFKLTYATMLSLMTSEYVEKVYI
jgi:predicted amino acid racemase